MAYDPNNDPRGNIAMHVAKASLAPGETDWTEAWKVAYQVGDYMVRSDAEPVGKEMSPAVAQRLLNAVSGLAIQAGLAVRGDEDVSNKGPVEKGPLPAEGKADAEKGDEPKGVAEMLGKLGDTLAAIDKRLEKLEGKGRSDGEDDPTKAKELAADALTDDERAALKERMRLERADAVEMGWETQHRFHEWQAKCDSIAGMYGFDMHAPRPMQGELLRDYRVRCLKPWQSLSAEYKHCDLKTLARVDGPAFQVAADNILAAAREEARHPKQVAPACWCRASSSAMATSSRNFSVNRSLGCRSSCPAAAGSRSSSSAPRAAAAAPSISADREQRADVRGTPRHCASVLAQH
jgi:hypothetical protein